MTTCLTPYFKAYRAAIIKAATDNPELVPPISVSMSDFVEMLAAFLADGNAGFVVFLVNRQLAGKILENIVPIEDYDLCAALRDAIQGATSLYDGQGEAGREFVTPTYATYMADNTGVATA